MKWPPAAAASQVCLSHGHGGSCALSHCSTGRWPPRAAVPQVYLLHGHGGSCALSHCSTDKLPRREAAAQVYALHGHGGFCALSHCNTGKWPSWAATLQVYSLHGHGGSCDLSHCSTGRWPPRAAVPQVNLLHGHDGSCALSHCSTGKWPCWAAAWQMVEDHSQGGCWFRAHTSTSRPPMAAPYIIHFDRYKSNGQPPSWTAQVSNFREEQKYFNGQGVEGQCCVMVRWKHVLMLLRRWTQSVSTNWVIVKTMSSHSKKSITLSKIPDTVQSRKCLLLVDESHLCIGFVSEQRSVRASGSWTSPIQ